MIRNAFILSLFVFLTSCGEDSSSGPEVLLPHNLKVTIAQSEENPKEVEVTVTAENVNFFRFYFGEDDSFEEQVEGKISHTYASSGDFVVTVQAHSTSMDFISYSEQVTIPEPDPGDFLPETGYITPESYEGMTLVWQDEFEGESLNLDDWTYEIGTGSNGWGNNELQYYTDENTSVVEGNLIIEAREEERGGQSYTSSRIITENKQEFEYGRVDIRAVLPSGQGIWPALWMLGANFRETGWPGCGEIDIMEMVGGGGREKTVHGTVHWSNGGDYARYGQDYSLSSGIFADEYHVFSIVWDDETITWYVDDVQYNVIDITPAELSEFRAPFFFVFNIAVGGNWPGGPNSTTSFPQFMAVDYIRVFQPD